VDGHVKSLPLTRRSLLGGGLFLAASYAAGHAWGHRSLRGPDGAFLAASPLATLSAALEALLPEGAPVDAMARDVDGFLAAGDPVLAGQLSVALRVLEHAGGAGILGFRRFSRLDPAARRGVLDRWIVSRIGPKRQIADAVRRVALFSYYARPETWPALGYDGPLVGR
jgi:hypothetical protein